MQISDMQKLSCCSIKAANVGRSPSRAKLFVLPGEESRMERFRGTPVRSSQLLCLQIFQPFSRTTSQTFPWLSRPEPRSDGTLMRIPVWKTTASAGKVAVGTQRTNLPVVLSRVGAFARIGLHPMIAHRWVNRHRNNHPRGCRTERAQAACIRTLCLRGIHILNIHPFRWKLHSIVHCAVSPYPQGGRAIKGCSMLQPGRTNNRNG